MGSEESSNGEAKHPSGLQRSSHNCVIYVSSGPTEAPLLILRYFQVSSERACSYHRVVLFSVLCPFILGHDWTLIVSTLSLETFWDVGLMWLILLVFASLVSGLVFRDNHKLENSQVEVEGRNPITLEF